MLSWNNWLAQARASLNAGVVLQNNAVHFMACFSFEQAAEMALKAGLDALAIDHHGHYLPGLLRDLATTRKVDLPERVASAARRLTRLYIPTRYPDAEGGVPAENYDADDARQAHADADEIMKFVLEGLSETDRG